MSPPASGNPEQTDGWMGQAEGQAAAPSQLLPPIQATALGLWGSSSQGSSSQEPLGSSSQGTELLPCLHGAAGVWARLL